MTELNFQTKDLAETSNSFFHRSGFQYRNQQKAIDYALLRQTQKQRITYLFKNNPILTQDKLIYQFQKMQQETNQFIQSLLEQLAVQCKKVRSIQYQHSIIMRQKNTQVRKLIQKNIDLSSFKHSQPKDKENQKNKLQKENQKLIRISESYRKQLQGLRKLLQQYEQQLEQLQTKLNKKTEEINLKDKRISLMSNKNQQLTKRIEIHRQENKAIKKYSTYCNENKYLRLNCSWPEQNQNKLQKYANNQKQNNI